MAVEAKCSKCEKEAVKLVEWKKKYYCEEHFSEYFEGQVRKVFDIYKIPRHEKICVAISGGKDSVAMAYVLKKICKNIEAVHLNLGIGTYSEKSLEKTQEVCEELGIKLGLIDLKEMTGFSLLELLKKRRMVPCKVCGIVKRYLLNRFAYENGFPILAVGQTMDDIATHAINTLYSNYLLGFKSFRPFLLAEGEKTVSLLKPLFFLSEQEIEFFLRMKGIPYLEDKCPYGEEAFTQRIKKVISSLETDNPGFLRRFVSSLIQLSQTIKVDVKVKSCKKCGFPSLKGICSFCSLIGK